MTLDNTLNNGESFEMGQLDNLKFNKTRINYFINSETNFIKRYNIKFYSDIQYKTIILVE